MAEWEKIVSISLKLILILSIINSINSHLWHLMSANIFLLVLLFLKNILKSTKIQLPFEFNIILFFFVLATIILGNYKEFLAPMIFGVGIGFIGLLISLILYSSNQIKRNPFLITLFSFNLAMSFGVVLELFKFYIKILIGQSVENLLYSFTMMNLTYVLTGALLASLIGLLYMKTRLKPIERIIRKFQKKNPDFFKESSDLKEIIQTIKKGETDKIEFKSTLRTNLHTKEKDKKIEFSVLKTICAFMNSKGGTLLIGVKDSGEVLGIELDNFPDKDKFNLHLINIIKQNLGKKFLNKMHIELIKSKNKTIAKIDCRSSNEPIFLKEDKEEKFYIRTGPASTEISGKDLLDYVKKRFDKD